MTPENTQANELPDMKLIIERLISDFPEADKMHITLLPLFNRLKQSEEDREKDAVKFANAISYNCDYKGNGKWQQKYFGGLVDVKEYTTQELYQLFLKSKNE